MKASIPKSKRPLPKVRPSGLRTKPEEKSAWDRLPFVGSDHQKLASSWDVPLTGGFFGGIEVGAAIACMFIKYLRDERDNPVRLGAAYLEGTLIALQIKEASTPDEQHSLNGQRVGFIGELFKWIDVAAMHHGSALDSIPQRSFVQQVNEHLVRTDDTYMAAVNSKVSP